MSEKLTNLYIDNNSGNRMEWNTDLFKGLEFLVIYSQSCQSFKPVSSYDEELDIIFI